MWLHQSASTKEGCVNYYKCNGAVVAFLPEHDRHCENCKPLTGGKQSIQRAMGIAALKGENFIIYSCPTHCVDCNMEERGTLWLTTEEPPRSLEELLNTTEGGKK